MTTLKNIAIAIASIVVTTASVQAQAVSTSYDINQVEPLTVKYLGDDARYLIFEVTLQSKKPASTLFAVDDKSEGELYASVLENSYKVQTIKIEKRSGQVIDFKLFVGSKTYSKTFAVNNGKANNISVAETAVSML